MIVVPFQKHVDSCPFGDVRGIPEAVLCGQVSEDGHVSVDDRALVTHERQAERARNLIGIDRVKVIRLG